MEITFTEEEIVQLLVAEVKRMPSLEQTKRTITESVKVKTYSFNKSQEWARGKVYITLEILP